MTRLRLAMLLLIAATSAQADPWYHHDHPRDFHHYDQHVWMGGNWYHGNYMGRVGWYWIVGSTYYYYPEPVYPYPNPYIPPTIVVQPTPAPQQPIKLESQPQQPIWYFCESANGYYPYVSECNGEWKTIPATPPSPKQ